MAKQRLCGWMHEPLAAVFGTRAKVAALRILWRAATPIAYREVVRRSGMAYGSIDLALGDLTAVGLVEEMEGGRERRVRLRSSHRLASAVANLLQVESDFFATLRVELRTVAQWSVGDGLIAAAVVGSVARREELLGGALDLLIIATDVGAVKRSVTRFDELGESLAHRFGVRLTLVSYDLATARAMWRTRTVAAERSVKEAELLVGTPLEELLSVGQ